MRLKPRNLFVYPRAKVLAWEPLSEGGQAVRLSVSGMVCDLWARRVQRALAGLKGVSRVSVDLHRGEATLETVDKAPLEALERAVHGQVILARARGILARVPFLGRRAP